MIKRFSKNKPYTLALLQVRDSNDFSTWCVNVHYRGRIGNVLEFTNVDGTYVVDLETHLVHIECLDYGIFYDEDGREYVDETSTTDIATLTNIVAGWQW